jgi:hypothetical protein
MYGVINEMTSFPYFWLIVSACPFVCLVPDIFLRLAAKVFFPTPVDKVLRAME